MLGLPCTVEVGAAGTPCDHHAEALGCCRSRSRSRPEALPVRRPRVRATTHLRWATSARHRGRPTNDLFECPESAVLAARLAVAMKRQRDDLPRVVAEARSRTRLGVGSDFGCGRSVRSASKADSSSRRANPLTALPASSPTTTSWIGRVRDPRSAILKLTRPAVMGSDGTGPGTLVPRAALPQAKHCPVRRRRRRAPVSDTTRLEARHDRL